MADDGDRLLGWLEALDGLSYYDLFGLQPESTPDEIHDAFHVFCETFHPDGHMGRSEEERGALGTIFKRGTEAYVVLGDPGMRAQYDAQLAVRSSPNPPRVTFSPLSRPPASRAPGAAAPLDEAVRVPSARQFARRAEELLRKGDLKQAKLQLVMASHLDPGNEVLEAALSDLLSKLDSPK
jgi:curved DNA-binding protein CbpA